MIVNEYYLNSNVKYYFEISLLVFSLKLILVWLGDILY